LQNKLLPPKSPKNGIFNPKNGYTPFNFIRQKFKKNFMFLWDRPIKYSTALIAKQQSPLFDMPKKCAAFLIQPSGTHYHLND
jgi:hypothetical protein